MYYNIELINNINIDFFPSLLCSFGSLMIVMVTFGGQQNSKFVTNPDFENLKHLQNPDHLPLNEASILQDPLDVPRNSLLGQ